MLGIDIDQHRWLQATDDGYRLWSERYADEFRWAVEIVALDEGLTLWRRTALALNGSGRPYPVGDELATQVDTITTAPARPAWLVDLDPRRAPHEA